VSEKIIGSVDGLMVIDSLGGESLAARIDVSSGWREFVMYRAASQPGELTVTFALTGLGDVWIDDVSIRLVRSARPHSDGNFAGNAPSPYTLPALPSANPSASTWNGRTAALPDPQKPLFAPPQLR
jgi:hypothetical protein